MAGRLRILTANLWNGRADPDGISAQLRDLEVDVACFQELAPDQAEAIATVLPHGRLEPAMDHMGMGIALRAPAALGALAMRLRDLRFARLEPDDWPGVAAPLTIWNVHIEAPHTRPMSLLRRRHQLRALLRHLESEAAGKLVLVGDFNATPLWPVYRGVAGRLRDAARDTAQRRGERPRRTWTPLGGDHHPRLLRIDHVFVRGVEAAEVRTVNIVGSDHDALVVDLEIG
jgi:endonuclease/exonuclease/phosphatase (EEP) superfamily protein YafD